MVLINSTTMQAMAKIVYYGPGLCGKTTNLHHIHLKTAPGSRGEMLSLETETDRTLFFDLLPLEVGMISGLKLRLQLYTVPGQVFYNATRKMVLKNVDGIVFVADSQEQALEANIESFENLKVNLGEMGLSLDEVPLVLQYNKRDLRDIASVETLQHELNWLGAPHFEAAARHGLGVFETLKGISRLALNSVRQRVAPTTPGNAEPAARPIAPAKSAGSDEATRPMSALRDVDFAEENTGKYAVRPVATKGDDALHERIERVREGQLELERRAQIAVPRELLRASQRIGVHLSFQGEEVQLKDALSIKLTQDGTLDRLRLRLDLEIEREKK